MNKYKVLFIIIISISIFPVVVNAETIQDYRNKIKAIEAEKAENESKSAEVQERIEKAQARINEITRQIVQARKDQDSTREEIDQLDKDIEKKEQEIKDLMAFYQISDSENFYLKYIFGADSFEDFIYRFSVAEQLADANDKLVDEMNDLIKQNEEKIKELDEQQKELNNLNNQIQAQVKQLGSQKREYSENALDADEEIKALEDQIEFFKSEGCSETQDVTTCSVNVPSSSGFILPTPYGYITSYYGGRIHPVYGVASYHDGIDIAASTGTTVMASSTGKVIYSYLDNYSEYGGFGIAVLIAHNVNGESYTTLYGHLSSASVKSGQIVQRGQKIGEVGSTGVSTGPHLHFQTMYGVGYGTTFDPMLLVNIPLSW